VEVSSNYKELVLLVFEKNVKIIKKFNILKTIEEEKIIGISKTLLKIILEILGVTFIEIMGQ